MAKQTPNYLDQETVTKAVPVLTKLFDSMSFFYTRLKDHPQEEDMQTHMRLFESYCSELSDLFGYHSNATEKRNKLFANLRDERKRLEEDKKRFANATSPIQVTACLKRYEDIFTAWYESNGFHYANLQKTMNHGFLFDVSDELEKEQDCNLTSDNEFFTWCCQRFCKIQDHTSCDFYADAYHAKDFSLNSFQTYDSVIMHRVVYFFTATNKPGVFQNALHNQERNFHDEQKTDVKRIKHRL